MSIQAVIIMVGALALMVSTVVLVRRRLLSIRYGLGWLAVSLGGLICHHDAGSHYTSVAYTDRVDELGGLPSIGTVGDSYDNALAEAVNALFKTELLRNPAALRRNGGPWKNLDQLEMALAGWVAWFNEQRLHSELGDVTPAEHEDAHYALLAQADAA